MAKYALDAYSPTEMAEIDKRLQAGECKKKLLVEYEFSSYTQFYNYLEAYRSGDKWRFSIRFYIHELEPKLKGKTLEEAYHYCKDNGYTIRTLRRFEVIMRELRVPLAYAYKQPLYMFRGNLCNCSEIYKAVKGAFSRRVVYNFCREHGYFDEYEAPEKRRRPNGYPKLVDLAIAYGYSYEQLRLMFKDGASIHQIEDYLKEAA